MELPEDDGDELRRESQFARMIARRRPPSLSRTARLSDLSQQEGASLAEEERARDDRVHLRERAPILGAEDLGHQLLEPRR
jgi:hypothetical protein